MQSVDRQSGHHRTATFWSEKSRRGDCPSSLTRMVSIRLSTLQSTRNSGACKFLHRHAAMIGPRVALIAGILGRKQRYMFGGQMYGSLEDLILALSSGSLPSPGNGRRMSVLAGAAKLDTDALQSMMADSTVPDVTRTSGARGTQSTSSVDCSPAVRASGQLQRSISVPDEDMSGVQNVGRGCYGGVLSFCYSYSCLPYCSRLTVPFLLQN